MKYLKLLLIFLVLVGGIFVILIWSPLSPTTRSQQEDNLSEEDKCKEISDAWEKEKGWNLELYKTQRADIDQDKALNLLSPTVYNVVDNRLHEIAVNRVYEAYMYALKNSREAEMNNLYNDVQTVKRLEQMGNDPNIREIEQIQQLYSAIKKFNSSRHSITPQYNPRTNSWVSFNDLQSKIVSEASALSNNPMFPKVRHLPACKDLENVKNTTEALKHSFYQNLWTQIKSQAGSEQLNDAKERLINQYPSLAETVKNDYLQIISNY